MLIKENIPVKTSPKKGFSGFLQIYYLLFWNLIFCCLFMCSCGYPPHLASVNYCLMDPPLLLKGQCTSKSGMT